MRVGCFFLLADAYGFGQTLDFLFCYQVGFTIVLLETILGCFVRPMSYNSTAALDPAILQLEVGQ